MQKQRLTMVLTIIALLPGCAAPQERARDGGITLTQEYAGQPEISAGEKENLYAPLGSQKPWWEYYENEELDALVETALDENPGLQQTKKRLEQAAASARRSYADLLPGADVSASRSTDRGDNRSGSDFTLRGAASYELDIWGGNRASYRASDLEAWASAEDIRTAAITLSASVVENWLRLLSLREEEALLKDQIKTNEMVLDLQHKRYANGVAEALDVLQQKEVLERTRANLPDVKSDQEITAHQLSILAGQNPSVPLKLSGRKLPEILPLPDTGIPARLLVSRPDIQAAWLRVLSADWAGEAARIDRLPNFNISADYVTSAAAFQNLFNTWMLDLALNLAMPLFDGGERAAEQARQEALADERFQNYRETVLNAIGEVEDALSLNEHQADKIEALESQLAASRNTLEQAQISYSNGDESYISVLNGLINVQSLEQQLVRERRTLALNRVALYRAIGLRTWTDRAVGMQEGRNG